MRWPLYALCSSRCCLGWPSMCMSYLRRIYALCYLILADIIWISTTTCNNMIPRIQTDPWLYVRPGPRLMTDTQHSTQSLNVFEWGNPERAVLILSIECWVSFIRLGPDHKLMTITQHSTLKNPDSAPCIQWGILSVERFTFHAYDSPIQIIRVAYQQTNPISIFYAINQWTDNMKECGVLSLRHKSVAW